MSKRNIAFSKPAEPAFLRRIKEQAGYKEGPTVDTKRQELDAARPEDFEDTQEEQPTVVVLRPGDLSAEEADRYQRQLDKEEEEKPADLAAPVVFKAPEKKKRPGIKGDSEEVPEKKKHKKDKKPQTNKSLLSFDDDEDQD